MTASAEKQRERYWGDPEFRKKHAARKAQIYRTDPVYRLNAFRSAFDSRCRRLGWTVEDVARALNASGLCCELCGEAFGEESFHMDHCHRTGKFRGVLCGRCNHVIAAFRDDVGAMKRWLQKIDAIAGYLGR